MTEVFVELLKLDKALNEACIAWREDTSIDTDSACELEASYDYALNNFEFYLYEHRDDFSEEERRIIEYAYNNSCTVAEAQVEYNK